jgi:hypothetical protein
MIGDSINVTIVLYSGYRERRTIGGDYLRVWMAEPSKKAISCAHIIDHNNGSYSAILKALWVGTPDLVISLVNAREAIRAMYAVRKQESTLRYIIGQFKKGTHFENTRCLPTPTVPGYQHACNLTNLNYGMSWFCGKPSKYGLECKDLDTLSRDPKLPHVPLTDAERILLTR